MTLGVPLIQTLNAIWITPVFKRRIYFRMKKSLAVFIPNQSLLMIVFQLFAPHSHFSPDLPMHSVCISTKYTGGISALHLHVICNQPCTLCTMPSFEAHLASSSMRSMWMLSLFQHLYQAFSPHSCSCFMTDITDVNVMSNRFHHLF